MNSVTNKAYNVIFDYVKRNNQKSTFDSNTLRTKLRTVKGLRPAQYGGVIRNLVQKQVIVPVGTSQSTVDNHKGGTVNVYTRGYNSYIYHG